jgi:hypothetical protein
LVILKIEPPQIRREIPVSSEVKSRNIYRLFDTNHCQYLLVAGYLADQHTELIASVMAVSRVEIDLLKHDLSSRLTGDKGDQGRPWRRSSLLLRNW